MNPSLSPLLLLLMCNVSLNVSGRVRGHGRVDTNRENARSDVMGENTSETHQSMNFTRRRDPKIFSIFSVVQFANLPCVSTSTFPKTVAGSQFRNGTCLTSAECSSGGGTSAGSCAAGFGVCCVFTASSSANTVSRNCTYLQNPGFPSTLTTTTAISYTINKCSCDVCFLRLDFECFTTRASGASTEVNGGQCIDTFTVTTPTGFAVPTICGENSGQHLYVDMGDQCGDSVTLNFAFTGTVTTRTWDIKASQIPCGSTYTPPNGCLQYHTELDGRFNTFNFITDTTVNENHLANQQYSICIRQAEGFCCVRYSVCNDATAGPVAMTLGAETQNGANNANANQDDQCSLDYVGIEGSADTCNQSGVVGQTRNRYCGPRLNTVVSAQNIDICDCSAPFEVEIITDAADDTGTQATINAEQSRGVCLEYSQVPCAA